MNWRTFTYSGTIHEFSHLNAFEFRYLQPTHGENPEREYSVLVSFGHHCFTRGAESADALTMTYPHGPRRDPRIFDPERYTLSKRLPDIIKGLISRNCFHTGRDDGTYFVIEVMDENGDRFDYEVYFKVFRNEQRQLRLVVESAFRRDTSRLASRPKTKPIRFGVILYNTQQGRPIRTPR